MTKRRLAFVLIVALLAASCFIQQLRGDGRDFTAYYKAANRLLSGEAFYVFEGGYAFKYAPLTVFYFIPFAWLPFEWARWAYALVHLSAAILVPVLAWRLVAKSPAFLAGLVCAVLGAFRFVDGEFRASNIGMFLNLALLTAALVQTAPRRYWGPFVLALGAVIKIHSLVAFFAYRLRDRRTAWVMGGVLSFLILIPSPHYWFAWAAQMRNTQGVMPLTPGNLNLQGFFPFAMQFFGWDGHSEKCFLLAAPFAIVAAKVLPRFSIDEAGRYPSLFFRTASAWVWLALMSSPLPWQQTYSLLWAVLPVMWCFASKGERIWIASLCIFLGASNRDIIGVRICTFLETNQSVFIALLILWGLLLRQVTREKDAALAG